MPARRAAQKPITLSVPRSLPSRQHPASLSPFRMNTSKTVSKQRLLSPFRMNTYTKHQGGLFPPNFRSQSAGLLPRPPLHGRTSQLGHRHPILPIAASSAPALAAVLSCPTVPISRRASSPESSTCPHASATSAAVLSLGPATSVGFVAILPISLSSSEPTTSVLRIRACFLARVRSVSLPDPLSITANDYVTYGRL
jgi:hypothetical protein